MIWQGTGCIIEWDILREFLGYNFVSGIRTLKPKKPLKLKKTLLRFPALNTNDCDDDDDDDDDFNVGENVDSKQQVCSR